MLLVTLGALEDLNVENIINIFVINLSMGTAYDYSKSKIGHCHGR